MKSYSLGAGLAACVILGIGIMSYTEAFNQNNQIESTGPVIIEEKRPTPTEMRAKTSPNPGKMTGKKAVNLEGVITEVIEDGKKIKVGDKWIIINEDTVLGIDGPTAAPKDEQFFESEFKVGNSISGFTLDDLEKEEVVAYAIYSNWKWEK